MLSLALTGCRHPGKTATENRPDTAASEIIYPATRTVDQVDNYHGTNVADPYRWLEDMTSDETRAWIDAENRVTASYLATLPGRAAIHKRLTELWTFERYGLPERAGSRYFFTYNSGTEEQDSLWMSEGLHGDKKLLLDFNAISPDGKLAFSNFFPSPDGRYVAYSMSISGSDWKNFYVYDVDAGTHLRDIIEKTKFTSPSWDNAGQGFYYARVGTEAGQDQFAGRVRDCRVFYHSLGDAPENDRLVYERPEDPEAFFWVYPTEDDAYEVLGEWTAGADGNRIYYRETGRKEFLPLFTDNRWSYNILGNDGPVWYVLTNDGAPLSRVIAVDLRDPERAHWRDIVPESDIALNSASIFGDKVFISYLRDVCSEVEIFGLDGRRRGAVALPGLGSVRGFSGRRDAPETFFRYTGYTSPATSYRYDLGAETSEVFQKLDVDFNPDDYTTERVFYTSKDGTRVPLFLTHKKGLRRNGRNPTILYGYGGFNVSIRPGFSVSRLAWMEMGGVYAVANLRGGGEYGEDWHQAGMKLNKQNVFDDFIAAAEWLIDNKYASSKTLAINGGSNGGLLVGACLTQRPDLFAAAVPEVGVLDMLRYHKFTIGYAWAPDYGVSDNPEEFRALLAYSPLHNVKPGARYPATMVMTSDHDDRVVPLHSFKFAAALQAAQGGPAPVLIRVQTTGGHGGGTQTSMIIDEFADMYVFLAHALGMKLPAR